jgi:hypothetical protein
MAFFGSVRNIVDTNNAISGSRTSGSTFTGTWTDCLLYSSVTVYVTAAEDSAANGVKIQWNHTNSGSEVISEDYSITPVTPLSVNHMRRARYFRMEYVQGAATGDVELQVVLQANTAAPNLNIESVNNSTTTPLIANASFVGAAEDILQYNQIVINIFGRPGIVAGDGSNASGSLFIDFSPDGTNWDVQVPNFIKDPSLVIPTPLIFILRYFRVRYINDGGSAAIGALGLSDPIGTPTTQTMFRLTTYLSTQATKELTRTLDQSISGSDPVALTRTVNMGRTLEGTIKNALLGENTVDQLNKQTTLLTTTAAVTFTAAVSDVITSTAHGLVNNDLIIMSSTGTLPAGLAEETQYYVINATANTFEVSLTVGGSAVDITDTGTGTHSWYEPDVFTGPWIDTSQMGHILHFGAWTGSKPTIASIEWSDDGITKNTDLLATGDMQLFIIDGFFVGISIINAMIAKFYRVRIVNGTTDQTSALHYPFVGKESYKGSYANLDSSLGLLSTALLTRSVIAGTKPDASFGNVVLNQANALVTADFNLQVAQGLATGYKNVAVAGTNLTITSLSTPEDIWNGGGLYTGQPTTAPETVTVTSSSINDTSAGTGMQTIRIYGLKTSTSTDEETEDITLAGIGGATSVNTWYRIYTAEGLTYGSGGTNAGNITINHTTTTANVFIDIAVGRGVSTIAAYTVPAGKTAYLQNIYIIMGRANGSAAAGTVSIRTKPNNTTYSGNAIRAYTITTGLAVQPNLIYPIVLTENTDIVVRVDSVSETNDQTFSANLDLVLITN